MQSLKIAIFLAASVFTFLAQAVEHSVEGDQPLEWVTDAVAADNVEFCKFFSEAVNAEVSYHIYLPAEYYNNTSKRFPVLYWLHGSGGGLPGIPVLSSFFDSAIVSGQIPPMLVVFPNGLPSGMWCNWKDGSAPVESMLINDLIPYIDQTYRTINSAEGRIIEGFSMGGYGAARLGLKFPEMFSAFSMLGSGPLQLDFSDPKSVLFLSQSVNRFLKQFMAGIGIILKLKAPGDWRSNLPHPNSRIY